MDTRVDVHASVCVCVCVGLCVCVQSSVPASEPAANFKMNGESAFTPAHYISYHKISMNECKVLSYLNLFYLVLCLK